MGWLDAANAWLSAELGASSGLAAFGLLLVGGVLASLLPCVYPLYPVTAAILSRRESKLGRAAHPLTYYAGLAAVYFLLGLGAALTGGSFNALLRLPAVNLALGALLVLLALATAGMLHFPTWAGGTGKERGGLLGTLLMGAGAGLLSSACVGPVVVSILVSIASATESVSLPSALLAATKVMLFGLGVGLPLLLIGVFGLALPKAGVWMVRVQRLFGLLVGWFALGYVTKGLSGVGVSEGASTALLAGVALVGASVYLAADAELLVEQRTKRAVLAVAFVLGVALVLRSSLAGQAAPAAGSAAQPSIATTEQHGNLTWYLDKQAAYAAASASGKPVFIDFFGDWCSNCKAFEAKTLADPELNAALGRAVLLKVRDTTALFDEYRRDPRFPELKVGLPFFLITDAKGELLYKTTDYTRSSEMMLFLPQPGG
jgi:thiol:disulfide interchange protein DsbD